jgi:hypothetical protein
MRGQTLNLSFNVRLGQIKRADGTGAFAVGWTEEDAIYVSPESCGCTARIHLMCHFPVRQGKPDSLEMQVEPRVCRVDRVNSVSSDDQESGLVVSLKTLTGNAGLGAAARSS